MLPSTSDQQQELALGNNGSNVRIRQIDSVMMDNRDNLNDIDRKVQVDHGLTPEEAAAFDELTTQVGAFRMGNGSLTEQSVQTSSPPVVETTRNAEQTCVQSVTVKAEEAEMDREPKEVNRRSSVYLERNLALLDSSGLSGNYWKKSSASVVEPNLAGRPKRSKAGAKMITQQIKTSKPDKKNEVKKQGGSGQSSSNGIGMIKANKYKPGLPQPDKTCEARKKTTRQNTIKPIMPPPSLSLSMAMVTRTSTVTVEEPIAFSSANRSGNFLHEITLTEAIAVSLCIPEEFCPQSTSTLINIFNECQANESTNSGKCEPIAPSHASFQTDLEPMEEDSVEPLTTCNSLEETGNKKYPHFNSYLKEPLPGSSLSNFSKCSNSTFYFRFPGVGTCERLVPCISYMTSRPTNLEIKYSYEPSTHENWFDEVVRHVSAKHKHSDFPKTLLSRAGPTHAMTSIDEVTGVLLSADGIILAFVAWTAPPFSDPVVHGCCLANEMTETPTVFPWLTLPKSDYNMEYIFYEIPDDFLTMSGIWLLEVGAIICVKDMLNEMKAENSKEALQHKFKYCHRRSVQGPDYVTLVSKLPRILIYGPILKDYVLRDPDLVQEYVHWCNNSTNSTDNGLISYKPSVFSSGAIQIPSIIHKAHPSNNTD